MFFQLFDILNVAIDIREIPRLRDSDTEIPRRTSTRRSTTFTTSTTRTGSTRNTAATTTSTRAKRVDTRREDTRTPPVTRFVHSAIISNLFALIFKFNVSIDVSMISITMARGRSTRRVVTIASRRVANLTKVTTAIINRTRSTGRRVDANRGRNGSRATAIKFFSRQSTSFSNCESIDSSTNRDNLFRIRAYIEHLYLIITFIFNIRVTCVYTFILK